MKLVMEVFELSSLLFVFWIAFDVLFNSFSTLINVPVDFPASEEEKIITRDVTIFLGRQMALFRQNGIESNLALVSTGSPGYETLSGNYEVQYRRRAPVSSTFMIRMPYWVCINPVGDLGFHQGPPGADSLLGKPVSHGCIRLSEHNARWAYYWLVTGSAVKII